MPPFVPFLSNQRVMEIEKLNKDMWNWWRRMEPQSNQSQELLDAGREKFMKGKITEIKFFKSTV